MNKIIVDLGTDKERALSLVDTLESVKDLLAGWRVSSLLVYTHGIQILELIKSNTDLPIIFDGEKLATGNPEIIREQVYLLASSGVDQIVGCPMGGPETLESFVETCHRRNVAPVLEMMTPNIYFKKDSSERILIEAQEMGVNNFIYPTTAAGIKLLRKQSETLKGIPGLVLKAAEFGVHAGWTKKLKDLGVTEFIVDRAVCGAPDSVEAVKDLFQKINKSD